MYNSDITRSKLFESAITTKRLVTDRVAILLNKKSGVYSEIIKEDEFKTIFGIKEEYKTLSPLQMAEKFVSERLEAILESKGYTIDEDLDYQSSDFYDGYELNVPFKLNESYDYETLFEEIDYITERPKYVTKNRSSIGGVQKPEKPITPVTKNRSSIGGVQKPEGLANLPLNQEPDNKDIAHLPISAKIEKMQNPHKVDLLLKTVFESVFLDYKLSTDTGDWKPIKTLKENGKLVITWENIEHGNMKIETLIFPEDSNKINILVKDGGEVMVKHFFEIYRIPTNEFLVEKFFRKTYFNLLKKFIDSKVITLSPFFNKYVFWKTDNPSFSYSFSSPKKNKIIKDLIAFISIARHPILDDFFEANNLKHKQGYLQNLLDSSEAAGIFRFVREGNEIIIVRGANYKAFLNGKIRRVG